jgi:hypothetical protein
LCSYGGGIQHTSTQGFLGIQILLGNDEISDLIHSFLLCSTSFSLKLTKTNCIASPFFFISDIDECAEGRHNCIQGVQMCVNTLGGYNCVDQKTICGHGFRYNSTYLHCQGNFNDIYVYVYTSIEGKAGKYVNILPS